MKMEHAQSAENITNSLMDNALHLTKIQNVKSGVKKKFVNAVTIQTSTTLITTIFVQRKKPTALKLTCRMVHVQNAIKVMNLKMDNVFLQAETFDFLLFDFFTLLQL